jgi:hypothetical protein
MKLIAKKPCSFNGQTFYIGDEIPPEFVINPKAQENLGTIAIVSVSDASRTNPAEDGQVEFGVPIKQKDGTMTLYLNKEQICRAVEVMQMTTSEAKEAIKEIADEKILILLNACDSRKAVKEATEAAAAELNPEEDVQEESVGDE